MRALFFAGLFISTQGCSLPDPCGGTLDVCIGLHVRGNVTGLDQLAITLDRPMPKTLRTPQPSSLLAFPVSVALILPPGTSGTVMVAVDGLSMGQAKAHDQKSVKLPPAGSVPLDLTLDAGTAIDAGPLDGSSSPDQSLGPNVDAMTD